MSEHSDDNSVTSKSESIFREIEKLSVINGIELKVKIPLNLIRLQQECKHSFKLEEVAPDEAEETPDDKGVPSQNSTEEEEIDVIGISPIKPVKKRNVINNVVKPEKEETDTPERDNLDLRDLVIRIDLKQLRRIPKRKVTFDKDSEPDEKKPSLPKIEEVEEQDNFERMNSTPLESSTVVQEELDLDERPAINESSSTKNLKGKHKDSETINTSVDSLVSPTSQRKKKGRSKKVPETET